MTKDVSQVKEEQGTLGSLPQGVLDQLPQQILFLDPELRIVYLNKAAVDTLRGAAASIEEAYGCAVEQLIGRPLPELCLKPHLVETSLRGLEDAPRRIALTFAGQSMMSKASRAREVTGQTTGYLLSEDAGGGHAAEVAEKIEKLVELTRVATAGDLTQEFAVHGDDAIDELGLGLGTLFAGFRTKIGTIGEMAKSLYGSAQGLSDLSEKLRTGVANNSERVRSVSSAGEEISEHIQAVATAVEEMSVNVREIAKNAVEAANVAGEAVQVAEATEGTINRLGSSSEAIGKVVKVITSIAQQTNLLALNATIEAARAGDAGKGFAVVANEVKELAKQTSSATDDIGQKVEAIQRDTKEAVAKIEQIGAIIGRVNDHQDSIAGAVEQQTTVVNEIARNLTEAAEGTSSIADNISSVAKEVDEIKVGADGAAGAATSLAQLGIKLQMLVKQFKY